MLLPAHVKRAQNTVLERRDIVIADAKSVIRLPPADWSTEVCTFRGILPFPRSLGGSDQGPKDS
jgi:hypothetical protein